MKSNKTVLIGLIILMLVVLSIGSVTRIGNWGNFSSGVSAPAVNTSTAIFSSSPWVDIRAYGAKVDGATDDYNAVQSAINTGYDVFIPAGITFVNQNNLSMITYGQRLFGAGRGKSIIRAGAGVTKNILNLTAVEYGYVGNLAIQCNGNAYNGISIKDAARTKIERVDITSCTNAGVLFATNEVGNANLMVLDSVYSASNAYGYSMNTSINPFTDNMNGISFIESEANANTVDGILAKGYGGKIIGGIYQANGRYGIELGNSSDNELTNGWTIIQPWLEGNAAGGIYGTPVKSERTLILKNSASNQDLVPTASEDNLQVGVINDGQGFLFYSGQQWAATAGAAQGYVLTYINGTEYKIPIYSP